MKNLLLLLVILVVVVLFLASVQGRLPNERFDVEGAVYNGNASGIVNFDEADVICSETTNNSAGYMSCMARWTLEGME